MHPIRKKARPVCVLMTVLMLLISIPYQSALAALVETETMLNWSQAQDARDYVKSFLAREDAKAAMIAQGVDPLEAMARIDSLTDSEFIQIADQIEQLPAGGDALAVIIAVLIIVILVLVIIKLIK
ncbi:MAG: PA2779 family protein [Desulfobacterales bacterium]